MTLLFEVLAVFFVGMLPFMLSAFPNHYAQANKQLSNMEILIGNWTRAAAVVAVLLYIASQQPGGLAAIGLLQGDAGGNLAVMYAGVIVISLYIILMSLWLRLRRRKTGQPSPSAVEENGWDLPNIGRYRRFWERLSYLCVLVFMVLGEDLVSRGYLVYLLGNRLHNFIPGIILSVIFTLVFHLYQGKKIGTVIFHAAFAAFFIFLLLITGNLLAVIAGHLYYDILWTIGRWRRFDRQAVDKTRAAYTTGEIVFYSLFIVTNTCLMAGFVILAGFHSIL